MNSAKTSAATSATTPAATPATAAAAATTSRVGLYMAGLQFVFALGWTVYAIYLPQLVRDAGLPAQAVLWLLMLDQAIFTVSDFAMGVMADRMSRILGRLGRVVGLLTLLSSVAFAALPFVVGTGPAAAPLLLTLTIVWTVTASALRAPPLMLLGKYAAKPAVPWLAALTLVGMGVASALAPYLGTALRTLDPKIPFLLASVAVAATAFGLSRVEHQLAAQAPSATVAPRQPSRAGLAFVIAILVFGVGYQVHFALNSAPLFLRFAAPETLPMLMPVFWVGFNLMMFPASVATKKFGGFRVMGLAGLAGALALVVAPITNGLGYLVAAQFIAGAAWGALLMSAFSAAIAIGTTGAEGRVMGLMFSALALATFARIAAVAFDVKRDALVAAALPWLPAACWTAAGALLFAVVATLMNRRQQAP